MAVGQVVTFASYYSLSLQFNLAFLFLPTLMWRSQNMIHTLLCFHVNKLFGFFLSLGIFVNKFWKRMCLNLSMYLCNKPERHWVLACKPNQFFFLSVVVLFLTSCISSYSIIYTWRIATWKKAQVFSSAQLDTGLLSVDAGFQGFVVSAVWDFHLNIWEFHIEKSASLKVLCWSYETNVAAMM